MRRLSWLAGVAFASNFNGCARRGGVKADYSKP